MELLVDYSESWIPSTLHFSQETKVMMMLSPIQHLHEQHKRTVKNPEVAVTTCHLSVVLTALRSTIVIVGKNEKAHLKPYKTQKIQFRHIYTV